MTYLVSKKIKLLTHLLCLSFLILSCNTLVYAAEIRVAVASNFSETLRVLATKFEHQTNHTVIIIPGSTGKLYAQITHGAPYDAFFSADSARAIRLESDGLTKPENRFTYAFGKILLWSPKEAYVDNNGQILLTQTFRHLAIANPKLAPYGKAAFEVLQARSLWKQLKGRIVRGENIGQTFQFVKSGNAQLGFIALSQVKRPGQSIRGSYWTVPESLYQPLEQQAVQLKPNQATSQFMSFVQTEESQKLIQSYGYGVKSVQ